VILYGGEIYTLDPRRPRAEAIATRGDRILAVGSEAEVRSRAGDDRSIVDLGGKTVLPGFIDCHVHFLWGGMTLLRLDLRKAGSAAEFVAAVADAARHLKPGEWLIGANWDPSGWTDVPRPSRALIDPLTPDNPVCIRRTDGHSALTNTAALDLAGVGKDTPDPPGGVIDRDPVTGEPSGLLRDAAMEPVGRRVPPPTEEQKREALRRAVALALRTGVTSVHDMCTLDDVALYRRALDAGELRTRLYLFCHPDPEKDHLPEILNLRQSPPWIRRGGVKGYVDGSLGTHTALFFEPYDDEPGNRGIYDQMAIPLDRLEDLLSRADRMGLQLGVHAIGDRAVHELLDIYARIAERNGPRDRRFRVEHAQHLVPEDFVRFAREDVIASVQPWHQADDGRWAERAIGRERCRYTYALRSFLNAGARLAFGSDWAVAPLDPLAALRAAVFRPTSDGRHPNGWFPEERLTVMEAVRAHTIDAACAEFAEHEKGSLEPGKLADLVVLSDDVVANPDALAAARVELTMVGGEMFPQA